MTEYAVRESDGSLIRDGSWTCVSDVVGSFHGGFADDRGRVTGVLLSRENPDEEWREVDQLGIDYAREKLGVHCSVSTEQSTIAAEAHAAVYGDRGKDYGHPRDNFTDTARIWSALLHDKLSSAITAEDVARCMIGLKMARDLHSPKRDNRVDIVGYAITLDRLETGH